MIEIAVVVERLTLGHQSDTKLELIMPRVLICLKLCKISIENKLIIRSANRNYTSKMAEQNPDFNYSTDIFDKRLNKVPSFDLIYSYIVDHDLIDVIVEFAIYDKPVGIYNEPIVIFEIRTEF